MTEGLVVPYLRVANVFDGYIDFTDVNTMAFKPREIAAFRLKTADILLNEGQSVDLVGRCAMYTTGPEDCCFQNTLIRYRAGPETDAEFALQLFRYCREIGIFSRIAVKTNSIAHLGVSRFAELELPFPSLPEQRKIAEILRTWDEATEKLEGMRAAKERKISLMRQHFFEAEYSSNNRLRPAKALFEPVSERGRPDLPLLAVMQDVGIVRRDELSRRVAMPDGDTSSYKVVRPGDFVISLRSFEGGLEYSSVTGLVSPAYIVLRPNSHLIGDYYRHFFKSRSFIGRLDKLIFGIRDGKQIAFRDFGDMAIPAPPLTGQEAQARVLSCLEVELALEKERINAVSRQKRGLMQKLLTGEWRVNVGRNE